MSWISTVLVLTAIGLVAAQQGGRKPKPEKEVPDLTQRCLDCICQASSNCDETIKCHTSGAGYFCGPYVISWAYWHDGGRPGDKGRAHDFETCLNNKTCAEQAVKGYMRKYGQDCDGSGAIECYDYARIHKLGFSSCGGEAIYNSDYWEKFEICYDGYNPDENSANHYDQGGFVEIKDPNYGGDQGGYVDDNANANYGETVIQARSNQNYG